MPYTSVVYPLAAGWGAWRGKRVDESGRGATEFAPYRWVQKGRVVENVRVT